MKYRRILSGMPAMGIMQSENESDRNKSRCYSETYFNNGELIIPNNLRNEIAAIIPKVSTALSKLGDRERKQIN